MANIFQASVGYRDPAKSMTIKALENRLKAAQDEAAKSTQMTQPISDPMQGYGYLANILASGVGEMQAQRADINARDSLAKIKAGIDWSKGPDAQQYSDMSRLDPEGADKIMQDWVNYRQDMEKQAKQNEFTTSERQATEGYQTGEHIRQENVDEQQAVAANERLVEENKRKEQQGIDKISQEADARLAEGQKLGLTGQDLQRYAATGNMPVQQDKFNTPGAVNDLNKLKMSGNSFTASMDKMSRAMELLDSGKVVSGGLAQKVIDLAGYYGGDTGLEYAAKTLNVPLDQVKATQEYYGITDLNAMTEMSKTLSGSDSDRDVQNFQRILSSRSESTDVKRQKIQQLLATMARDRETVSQSLKAFGVKDGLGAYSYTPQGGYSTGGADDAKNMTDEQLRAIAAGKQP